MNYCDLSDNHSLMKLYNHKLETESIQRMFDFPNYIYNKGVSVQFLEQKCLQSNHWKM